MFAEEGKTYSYVYSSTSSILSLHSEVVDFSIEREQLVKYNIVSNLSLHSVFFSMERFSRPINIARVNVGDHECTCHATSKIKYCFQLLINKWCVLLRFRES